MKPLIYFLIIMLPIFSCKNTQKLTNATQERSEIELHEGRWYSNFKNEVFIRCLNKLYPQNFSLMIDTIDASSSANIDQLGYKQEIINIADSLANDFSKKKETSWTIEGKKVTLNVCMSYRNSIELDSIAVFFFRRFH